MMPSMSLRQYVVAILTAGVLAVSSPSGPGTAQSPGPRTAQAPGSFAGQIAALSEPGGYFDTDNLISNERSYLQVIPELQRAGVQGGAYIGVGPDQNFSYIAHIRPAMAFIVDIRRDNLLLHLLFKAIFAEARTRVEYLALLLGRPVPRPLDEWREAGIGRLVAYIDGVPVERQSVDALRLRLDGLVTRFGVALSPERPRDDRPLSSAVHRGGTRAALPDARAGRRKATTRTIGSSCSRPIRAGSRATFSPPKRASSSSSRCTRATGLSRSSVT